MLYLNMKLFLCISVFISLAFSDELRFSGGKDNIVHQVASEVLKRAYSRIGMQPSFLLTDLQKALILANSGQTDGEIARIKVINKKFTNLMLVPVVINYVEGISFANDKNIYVSNWKDLKKYKIGVARGAKFIETATKGMNVKLYAGFKEAFYGLEKREVDIIIAPKSTGRYIIHKEGLKDIKMVGEILQTLDLYHFLHKKNAHLIPKIVPVLQDMKKTGEIDYIRGYYFRKLIK